VPAAQGQAAPPAIPVTAARIQIPTNNGRVTLNPSATLVLGSHEETLEYSSAGPMSFKELAALPAEQGEVIFYVPVAWGFPPEGNRPEEAPLVGRGLAHIRVPFTVGPTKDKPDSVITWLSPRTTALNSEGGGATLTAAPVTTDQTSNGGAATITPTVQFQEQVAHAVTKAGDTLTITAGINAPLIGASESVTKDVGVGDTGGHQEQTQVSVTDSFSMSFTANVVVVLPKPEVVPTTATLQVLFAVNSSSTASGNEEKITTWYQTLDKKVRDSIESGKTKINLLGKASTTASMEHDRKLAEDRVKKVKEILSDLAGSDALFHTQAIGKSQPHREGEVAEERVVIVTLGDNRPAAVVSDEPKT
jgi:outer membrane protein OmpA-like peptidoglycan-associated protein